MHFSFTIALHSDCNLLDELRFSFANIDTSVLVTSIPDRWLFNISFKHHGLLNL